MSAAAADPFRDAWLSAARRWLRAAEAAERSMWRTRSLWGAAAELEGAGFPELAARADEAAVRLGGDGSDVRALLAEVEALCGEDRQ